MTSVLELKDFFKILYQNIQDKEDGYASRRCPWQRG